MKQPRAWFRIENAADPSVADIHIFDIIGDWIDDYFGFGISAKQFIGELGKLADSVKTIRLHVNSPGGDVFGAVAIANALRDERSKKKRYIDVSIEGLAASAATIITSAGDKVRIGDNALMMVHNPWTVTFGTAAEIRKDAEALDKVRASIIATYRWRSELSEADLGALMDATTWMTADEAITNGFADEKVEGLKAAASIDPRILPKLAVPEKYRERVEALLAKPAPDPAPKVAATPAEVLRECKVAACLDLAEGFITAGASLEDVKAKVAEEKAARATRDARATEIRGLCATAKLPELAEGYIAENVAPAAVKAHLTTITARMDKAEIETQLVPGAEADAAAGWTKAIAKVQGTGTRKGVLR